MGFTEASVGVDEAFAAILSAALEEHCPVLAAVFTEASFASEEQELLAAVFTEASFASEEQELFAAVFTEASFASEEQELLAAVFTEASFASEEQELLAAVFTEASFASEEQELFAAVFTEASFASEEQELLAAVFTEASFALVASQDALSVLAATFSEEQLFSVEADAVLLQSEAIPNALLAPKRSKVIKTTFFMFYSFFKRNGLVHNRMDCEGLMSKQYHETFDFQKCSRQSFYAEYLDHNGILIIGTHSQKTIFITVNTC